MRLPLLALAAAVSLALAGCSGDKDHADVEDFACPDGSVVTQEQIEEHASHHDGGFDPATLCPAPPQVLLTGLPATLGAYRSASFTWVVDPGSVAHGHSMLMSIRFAEASVPGNASLDGYPTEVIKKEHQDLPVTFQGNLSFTQPGKVYVRAYAQVQGEGYDRRDVWSEEVAIEVLPVAATGVVKDVTHAMGLFAGDTTPRDLPDLVLGDTLRFVNEDLMAHKLTLRSGPKGADCVELAAAEQGGEASCVMAVPGNYEYVTDDQQQPKTITVKVAIPTT